MHVISSGPASPFGDQMGDDSNLLGMVKVQPACESH